MGKRYTPAEIMPLYEEWSLDRDSVEVVKDGKVLTDILHVEPELIGDTDISLCAHIMARHWETGVPVHSAVAQYGFNYESIAVSSVELRRKSSPVDMYEWFLNRCNSKDVRRELKTVNHVYSELQFVYTGKSKARADIVLDGVRFENESVLSKVWLHTHATHGELLRMEVYEYCHLGTRRLYDIVAPQCSVVAIPGAWCSKFVAGDRNGGDAWKSLCRKTACEIRERTGHDVRCWVP
jgi:hypothetical protein